MTLNLTEVQHPEDVFGDKPREVYRRLARELHPDNLINGDEQAFKDLQSLWQAAEEAMKKGTYGQRVTVANVLVTTRRHAYKVSQILSQGKLATIYAATYPDGEEERHAILKVVRNWKNGRQLAHEAKVLRELLSGDKTIVDTLASYLPGYIEAFGYRNGRKTHQALAFTAIEDLIPMTAVIQAFPDGVDARDSAWMLRRLLLALGLTHALGWTHGHISPSHTLIHPGEHGLVLVDWTKARESGQLGKANDIASAVAVVHELTNKRMPSRLANFFAGCLRVPATRLPDALTLRDEFTELIEELWGPRKFRPFAMPR